GALSGLLPAELATIHPALVAQHVDARLRALSRADSRSRAAPVLVVDDAHLLDSQSAAVLLSLVSAKSLRLLATLRLGAVPSDAVTALWKENLLERLDLSPLDRAGSRELLESLLHGPVASGTVEMLWTSSHGNPFYLSQLARFGAERGKLELKAGVWWWVGQTAMPPRLFELLRSRISALSPRAQDAVEVLALGEPLPYETLAAVVDEEAILELDRAEIVIGDEVDGVLQLRFAHPLLHTVAEHALTGTRRRALARRLRAAPADHIDLVRRATWEEAGGGTPNPDLLLQAADAVMLHDSAVAVRLATRAHQIRPDIAAATQLAAAQSESGHPELARQALEQARSRVRTDGDRYRFAAEDFSLALWGERDPARARAVLERARIELPAGFRADLLGGEAVLRLFTGDLAGVLPAAEAALAADPSPSAEVRALTCLTGALTFTDRGPEALEAARRLLAALASTRVAATRTGLAHALVAVTELFHGGSSLVPRSLGTLGRWPEAPQHLASTPQASVAEEAGEEPGVGWPLQVGLRRHLRGDLTGALAPLREAFVQQQSGEGLFRSETAAELIVVLAELGHAEEAADILARYPPDAVAIIPGLLDWARAAVAAASGHHALAGAAAIEAARTAAERGAGAMALTFLLASARFGDPRMAAAVLPELGLALDSPVRQVRAAEVTARASRNPSELLAAAEAQLGAGFNRHAYELAELARRYGGAQVERPAAAVLRQARQHLGGSADSAAALPPGPLTHRETEVARLAGAGMSDREIADELVLSIRTVQSHLASVYRKLGIGSRTELSNLTRRA
ncbi:MAG: helix-turn-helix transcriptional regulator, partial [Actinomycetes bacterium]